MNLTHYCSTDSLCLSKHWFPAWSLEDYQCKQTSPVREMPGINTLCADVFQCYTIKGEAIYYTLLQLWAPAFLPTRLKIKCRVLKNSFTAVEVCTGSLLETCMEACEPSVWKSFLLWQEPLISASWSWTALHLSALFPTFHNGSQVPCGLFAGSRSVMLENKNKIAHLGLSRLFLWSHRIIPCTPPFSKGLPNFFLMCLMSKLHDTHYSLLVNTSTDPQFAFWVFKLCPQINLFQDLNNISDHLHPTWQTWDEYLSSSSVSSSGSLLSTYLLCSQAAGSSSESPILTTPPRSGSSNNFKSRKGNQKLL